MTRFFYAVNRFARLAFFAVGLMVCVGVLYGLMSRARSVAAAGTQLASTDGVWQPIERANLATRPAADIPQRAQTFTLNADALTRVLNTAARENGNSLSSSQTVLQIPLPSGDFVAFQIEESAVLDARLTKQFPEIKSYRGVAVNDGRLTMRADWTPQGFHALILTPQRNYNVLPVSASTTSEYAAYDAGQRDADTATSFECFVQERGADKALLQRGIETISQLTTMVGPTRRNYRIAISATNEYCATYGGSTLSGTVASLNTWLNGINAVYERELNIHLNMVSANNVLFYANANDPYTNGNPGSMLSEVRPVLRDIVGVSNFDIGHVIGTGGAGVAWLGVVCDNGNANGDTLGPIKGGGVSCISGTVGSASPLNLIMHEIGHQFGAAHSFNAAAGNCGSNRSPASGVEPGSGSTIMSYAGICGADNVAGGSDLRFHAWSFRQITDYVNAETCNTATSTGNSAPTVNGGSDYTIPRLTPFELTAVGNDADVSDVASLTYAWEQVDAGNSFGNPPYNDQNDAANSTRPLFRAYSPNASPTRTFPALNYILNYANTPPATLNGYQTADFLSYINRLLNFRVVARDQRGGVTDDEVRLTVNANAGPFLVTAPNTNVIWPGGSQQTVTWSVNNTNTAPINCANVRILLSTDGGLTFPHTLASSTANDGSETVTVPGNLISSTARVKVQASGNVFFDIADANFSITVGGTCPAVASISPAVGTVGTVVTINGANFTNVSAVRFGNANASFTIANDATMQATVPSGAGGGPLTIIKASCANASTPVFTLCPTAATNLQIDDGTFERSIGYSSGTQYFVNRLTPSGYPATVTTVSVAVNRPAGTVFEVIVGTNTDGNNNVDSTGFQAVSATSIGANQFITVSVPSTTINSGDFVVGYRMAGASGVFPGALDNNSTQQRSYGSGNGTTFSTLDSLNYPGNLGIRASVHVGTCNATGPVCPTITLSPATALNGVLNTAYSQTFTASGGLAPYSYVVSGGALPNGLTLSSAGVLSGTPTSANGFSFTIQATDTNQCTGTQSYQIIINGNANCPALTVSPASLTAAAQAGVAYSQTLTASGGAGNYSFSVVSGALPVGMTLTPSGILSGQPAVGGTFDFIVRVADLNQCIGLKTYSLYVFACPAGGCGTLTANPDPIFLCNGATVGQTTLSWTTPAGVVSTQVRVDSPTGGAFGGGGATGSSTTGNWVSNGTQFFLINTTNGASTPIAMRTVATTSCPAATLTATPNPIQVCDGTGLGVTTLNWSAPGFVSTQLRIGSPTGVIFGSSGSTGSATTGKWIAHGTQFFLLNAATGATIATTTANLTTAGCTVGPVTLTATPNPIQVCDGTGLGVTTLNWSAPGFVSTQLRIGSPTGVIYGNSGSTGSATTGKWIAHGTQFFLLNAATGATIATTTANLTTAGCTVGPVTLTATPNPIQVCDGTGLGVTTLNWSAPGFVSTQLRIGSPTGVIYGNSGSTGSATTGKWISHGTQFFLLNAATGATIATTTANLTTAGCGGAIISASPNPIVVCDGTGLGVTTITWNAPAGTTATQVRIGSPTGAMLAAGGATGSSTTGKWVPNGMQVFLVNASTGATLGSTTVNLTTTGCGFAALSARRR